MIPRQYEFHTTHISALALRRCSPALCIFIAEWMGPLQEQAEAEKSFCLSWSMEWVVWTILLLMWATLQLNLQYINVSCNTPNHMLAHGSPRLKQRLSLVTVAEHFHHYTLGGSPRAVTYNGIWVIFTHCEMPLLLYVVMNGWRCQHVNLWIIPGRQCWFRQIVDYKETLGL